MKLATTILTFFLCCHLLLASDTTIVFQHIQFAELFPTAKQEGKGVLLYFHFDGCGACLKMEKTVFNTKEVYDFYNSNFINFEVNTQKEDGIEINKKYNIQLHPTFIYFDTNGNEIHRIAGVYSPDAFNQIASDALHSSKNLTNFKAQYKAGNRDPDFLYTYIHMLRDADELSQPIVNEYLSTQSSDDLKSEKNIKFIYEFFIHRHERYFSTNSTIFHFMTDNKALFSKYFDLDQVNTRLMFTIKHEIFDAIERKDSTAFFTGIEQLQPYDVEKLYDLKEMDGRITLWTASKHLVLSAKMAFYQKMGNDVLYNQCLNEYINKIWDDESQLNNLAWNFFEETNNQETEKINTAIKCSNRSITLHNNYANNDTYAWLLYKSGDKENAFIAANKAINIAKQSNQDYSETQKLLDILKNER